MKLVSLAYFLAFALFVPMASHMIIYGLYLLRTYLFEHVATEAAAKAKMSEDLMDKIPLRAKSMLTLVGKPKAAALRQLSSEKDEYLIATTKRSPSPAAVQPSPVAGKSQVDVLKFESSGDGTGRKVRLKSVFGRTTERRRSVFPSTELPAVMSEDVRTAVDEQRGQAADSPFASSGSETERVLRVRYY